MEKKATFEMLCGGVVKRVEMIAIFIWRGDASDFSILQESSGENFSQLHI